MFNISTYSSTHFFYFFLIQKERPEVQVESKITHIWSVFNKLFTYS